jgi:nucleotidyltransferase/DNA polymerase involved in DNA repair
MRIACIHLPALPLQVFLRGAPQWLGTPLAIVRDRHVIACSRAAHAAGLRPGISAVAAHEQVPGLIVVSGAPAAEAAAVRALGEALLGVVSVVDVEARHAIYVQVPPRTRGASFGEKLLDLVEAQGLRARIGIADDRFTAWVAASHPHLHDDGEPIVTVPRGGSAAFLAPLPLALLQIPPEVQHVLEVMGVRTLGEFAALPPPTTSHGWDADYQALARGDGSARLEPFQPSGSIVERVLVGGEIGIGAALERVATRVAARLAGRGRAALTLIVRSGEEQSLPLPLPGPTTSAGGIADAAGHLVREGATFVEIEVPLAEPVALTSVAAEPVRPLALAIGPRDPYRRTRRGKDRTRAVVTAQARLLLG